MPKISLSLTASDNQTYADVTYPVDIDAFGVERSFSPYVVQPRLYLNVTHDLYEVDPQVPPVQRAEIMLDDDMVYNSKLKITWDIAVATNPTYNSVITIPSFRFWNFRYQTILFIIGTISCVCLFYVRTRKPL